MLPPSDGMRQTKLRRCARRFPTCGICGSTESAHHTGRDEHRHAANCRFSPFSQPSVPEAQWVDPARPFFNWSPRAVIATGSYRWRSLGSNLARLLLQAISTSETASRASEIHARARYYSRGLSSTERIACSSPKVGGRPPIILNSFYQL